MELIENPTTKIETRGRPKTVTIAPNEYKKLKHAEYQAKQIKCDICGVFLNYYSVPNHKKSKKHILNLQNKI